ncbi:MAG: 4Fe-4S dicluster domain-containing protein, partial [Phycisphaerae bacterium]
IAPIQPMIAPLYAPAWSEIELLAFFAGDANPDGHELVRSAWQAKLGQTGERFEQAWKRALHDGVLAGSTARGESPRPDYGSVARAIVAMGLTAAPSSSSLEVTFITGHVHDGRFANNGWLQELPEPLTKITWDNAARISLADGKRLGLANGDMIRVLHGVGERRRVLEIAAYLMPGQPDGVLTLPLGYGRRLAGAVGGLVGEGVDPVGFDTYQVRTTDGMNVAAVDVEPTGSNHRLALTQDHHLLDWPGRYAMKKRVGEKGKAGYIIREASYADYLKNARAPHVGTHAVKSLQLFNPPSVLPDGGYGQKHPQGPLYFNEPNAWGMAIDMNACTGCSACVVACQAENNIPVVGKAEVIKHREMHWLRIDRYFKSKDYAKDASSDDNPEVVYQPIMCVHCENAPCEQVCPVAATVHDSEGINTMVYNRCIGTRYCSNNCPYKVRRFNYYDWHVRNPRGHEYNSIWLGIPDTQQLEQINEIKRMLYNPEVTLRMRGVMEKCSYCYQRIQKAKIYARNEWVKGMDKGTALPDKEVVTTDDKIVTVPGDVLLADEAPQLMTACQQACPAEAITFGNLNDLTSGTLKQHRNPRTYDVLGELNTRPRGKHMAKIRNPNPVLSEGPAGPGDESPGLLAGEQVTLSN